MTAKHHHDRRAICICLAFSLLVHFMCAAPLDFFKPFQLGTPVQYQPIVVDLQGLAAAAQAGRLAPGSPDSAPPPDSAPQAGPDYPQRTAPDGASRAGPDHGEQRGATPAEGTASGEVASEVAKLPAPRTAAREPVELPAEAPAGALQGKVREVSTILPVNASAQATLPPIRDPAEFLATDRETLSYRISMLGIPVGDAELQAMQEKGDLRITLRIRSNPAISQLYPVDDSVETRHIGGNFILSRIRQREGSFIGDRGFTLFLRDKSVFWIDRIKNRSIQESLPNSSVVDILSGLYYLRNQPLEVGRPVLLQLFDSNRYAPTTVTVLRRERLTLPGFREVDTLVIQPQLTTEGVFRRTGDILIWLTDDVNKVPVKVETRVPLGKVTAELVSAQTHKHGAAPASGGRRASSIGENPEAAVWQLKSDPGP